MNKYLLFIMILMSGACRNSKEEKMVQIIKQFTGKKITLVDTSNYRSVDDPIVSIPQVPIKTLVYINGECGVCIDQLKEWNKILNDFKVPGQSDIFFFVKIWNFDYLKDALEKINFKYPMFVIKKANILDVNSISEYQPILHTMLLNKDNQIILIGNPIGNEAMLNLYKKEIKARSIN